MTVWRSKPYRKAFQFYPCVVCEAPSSEAAHCRIGFVGMGLEKPPDSHCTPLCSWCHRIGPIAQHKDNEADWWASYGVDPLDFAEQIHKIWGSFPQNVAGPLIIELIGVTHAEIQEHTNQAYLTANRQFAADPTPDFAPVVMDAYKRHIITTGCGKNFFSLVNFQQRKIDMQLNEASI